ncbi:hypothetical protein ACF07B_08825 [Streptomyces sp. NPDC015532]|uniref:hypothetical protein n=1 Tax=Streptomyces sp. NPDC015532 TaxID=3364960 RepID=UPI0036F883D2
MAKWQSQPLDAVHPVLFIDAIHVKTRDGAVANRPIDVVFLHVEGPLVSAVRDVSLSHSSAVPTLLQDACRPASRHSVTVNEWPALTTVQIIAMPEDRCPPGQGLDE